MQRDAEILPVSIRMKEIRDRFAIRAIRAVSPRNHMWKLANSSKLAKGDLEKLFARVKQSYSNFAQVMASWESISGLEA